MTATYGRHTVPWELNVKGSAGVQWHELSPMVKVSRNTYRAEACVDANSPWFQGHFPDNPILPGIAQLALVKAVVTQASGMETAVKELRRVRYRQMIRPGDAMSIQVVAVPDAPYTYKFKIIASNEVACSGTMCIGPTR